MRASSLLPSFTSRLVDAQYHKVSHVLFCRPMIYAGKMLTTNHTSGLPHFELQKLAVQYQVRMFGQGAKCLALTHILESA